MSMLYVLDVSALPPNGTPLRHADTQTAIFQETTTHMISLEDLQRRHPFKGPGLPEDIARMAVVLASDDASWMTGACVPVDGGYTAR